MRLCVYVFFVLLQTSVLCIAIELEGGGSLAVAVGISDMWQVTDDR